MKGTVSMDKKNLSRNLNQKSSDSLLVRLYTAAALFMRRFFAGFTGIVFCMALIGAALNTDTLNNTLICTQILWIALFSALIALVFSVTDFLAAKHVGMIAVRAVHFVLSYIFFYLTFAVGGAAESYLKRGAAFTNTVFQIICMSFLFVGVYAVIGFVRIGVTAIKHRLKKHDAPYEPLYSDLASDSEQK